MNLIPYILGIVILICTSSCSLNSNRTGQGTASNQTKEYHKPLVLLITNTEYDHNSTGFHELPKSHKDGESLAHCFKTYAGFDCIYRKDVEYADSFRALIRNKLVKQMKNRRMVIVLYSGHGVSSDGEDYIVPTHAPIEKGDKSSERKIRKYCLSAKEVISMVSDAAAPDQYLVFHFNKCRLENNKKKFSITRARKKSILDVSNMRNMTVIFSALPDEATLSARSEDMPETPYGHYFSRLIAQDQTKFYSPSAFRSSKILRCTDWRDMRPESIHNTLASHMKNGPTSQSIQRIPIGFAPENVSYATSGSTYDQYINWRRSDIVYQTPRKIGTLTDYLRNKNLRIRANESSIRSNGKEIYSKKSFSRRFSITDINLVLDHLLLSIENNADSDIEVIKAVDSAYEQLITNCNRISKATMSKDDFYTILDLLAPGFSKYIQAQSTHVAVNQ